MWFWDDYKPARPHQWNGSIADVRAAKLDGMAAYCDDKLVAQAGAASGLLIALVLRMLPVSPIRHSNLLGAALLLAAYGAYMGIWRKRDLISSQTRMLFNRPYYNHTLFSYVAIPLAPAVYSYLLPELDPNVAAGTDTFAAAAIMVMIFFWTGAVFDYVWEGVHNYFLVRLCRLDTDLIHTNTMRMWLRAEEKYHSMRLDAIEYHNGELTIQGCFENPAELRSKLEVIDFIDHAHVIQVKEHTA